MLTDRYPYFTLKLLHQWENKKQNICQQNDLLSINYNDGQNNKYCGRLKIETGQYRLSLIHI